MAAGCAPTVDELALQVEALAPRGLAWSTDGADDDGGLVIGSGSLPVMLPIDLGSGGTGGVPGTVSPRRGVWRSIARALAVLNERICALGEELFCATTSESLDLWLLEYGLPDACDPSGGDLCTKVALEGGARVLDLEAVAARYGYDVAIYDPAPIVRIDEDGSYTPGLMPGVGFDMPIDLPWSPSAGAALADAAMADCSQVGCIEGCRDDPTVLQALRQPVIPWAYTIQAVMSPATSAALGNRPPASAGCMMADCGCIEYQPDFSALECLFERVKPAHVRILYSIL